MSKVYETLKKKNDTSVEVYPNIERTNIPDGAINTAKLEDKAVNYNKLNDALRDDITHLRGIYDAEDDKLDVSGLNVSDDINCTNIDASNKVTTNDIEVTSNATFNDITINNDATFTNVPSINKTNTYAIMMNSSEASGIIAFTNVDFESNNISDADVNHALENKASISDFTSTDIQVYEIIGNGLIPNKYGQYAEEQNYYIYSGDYHLNIENTSGILEITLYNDSTSTTIYSLVIDKSTHTITQYIGTGIDTTLIPLKMFN